jgi:hypothetical protein
LLKNTIIKNSDSAVRSELHVIFIGFELKISICSLVEVVSTTTKSVVLFVLVLEGTSCNSSVKLWAQPQHQCISPLIFFIDMVPSQVIGQKSNLVFSGQKFTSRGCKPVAYNTLFILVYMSDYYGTFLFNPYLISFPPSSPLIL